MTSKSVSKIGLLLCYIGLIAILIVDHLSFIPIEVVDLINEIAMTIVLIGTTISTGALSATTEQLKTDKELDTPSEIVDRIIENTKVKEVERQTDTENVIERSDSNTESITEKTINNPNNIKPY